MTKTNTIDKLKFASLFIISWGFILLFYSTALSNTIPGAMLKIGGYIIDNHQIPTYDIISWNPVDKLNFICDNWLSAVLIKIVYSISNAGLFAMIAIISFIVCSIIIIYNRKNTSQSLLLSTMLLFLIIAIARNLSLDSGIFVILLFTILLFILNTYYKKDSFSIYFLPIISLLWANIQGSTSNFFYIVALIYLVGHSFKYKIKIFEVKKAESKKSLKLLIITFISILAMMINPYGVKIITLPYTNDLDFTVINLLKGFKSPDAKDMSIVLFCLVPFVLILIALITSNRKMELQDFLMYAVFAFLTLRSEYYLIFFIISASFYIFDYIILPNKITFKTRSVSLKPAMALTVIAIAALSFIFVHTNAQSHFINQKLDQNFIKLIKNDKPKRLFNATALSSDLIYNDIPVFIDENYLVYRDYNLNDYKILNSLILTDSSGEIQHNKKVTLKNIVPYYIDKYKFDKILISKNSRMYQYLINHSDKYPLITDSFEFAYFDVNNK